jgi:hypothetical protein
MRYVDYETVARSAGVPADELDELVRLFVQQEPPDRMLAELHILRACMAIKEGRLTLQTALDDARKLAA